jgi:hypothetical protein
MKIYKEDPHNLIDAVDLLKVVSGLYRVFVVLNRKQFECRHASKEGLSFIMITQFTQDGIPQNAYIGVDNEDYNPVAVNPDKYTIDIFFEHEDKDLEDYEHIESIGEYIV